MAIRQRAVNPEVALLVADVFEVAGLLRRSGEAIASLAGHTQARWQLLSVVSDEPRTVSQAARRLGVSRQAVQRVADDVVKAALASFEPNPDHRGSPLVVLSASGRDVLAAITDHAQAFHAEIGESLTDHDLKITRQVLRSLIDRITQVTTSR